MSENAFKNRINLAVVKKMGDVFHTVYPLFDKNKFKKNSSTLSQLELKQRVLLLTENLKLQLPEKFLDAEKILSKVLSKKELSSFELWPVSEYISRHGLEHFDESLELMHQLTQQFTSEFAVRPFLLKDPERVLKKLETWTQDSNVHVRRWISEGTRPILPWGGNIQSFIKKPVTLHLLEKLKYDDELYVRKSVANHLNDITKHHPERVIKTLKKWEKNLSNQHQNKIHWIKKHALRTLIKKGHKEALGLMGVSHDCKVIVGPIRLNQKKYFLGDTLEFSFTIESTSKKSQDLIIDYQIGFIKSNGKISAKIFKLKRLIIKAGEKITIQKKHSLKKITTMVFYPGTHELSIQVNGKILNKILWNFSLKN